MFWFCLVAGSGMLFCLEVLRFMRLICFPVIGAGLNESKFGFSNVGLAFADAPEGLRLGWLLAALSAVGAGVGLLKLPGAMATPSLIRGVSRAFSGGFGFEAIELALE